MFTLGIGTGRCGTQTLSTYLGLQKINTRHESLIMPWEFNQQEADNLIKHLQDAVTIDYPDVAEVNFSLLNYVEYLLKQLSTLKVIILKRKKEDTVRSWMKNQPYMNMWTDESHKSFTEGDFLKHSELSKAFPKYNLPKEVALAKFWDDYYDKSELLSQKYPDSIKIFDMYDLFSSENHQKDLLDFIEVASEKRFIKALSKKIDEKFFFDFEGTIKILAELLENNRIDLNALDSRTKFDAKFALKFLLLGVCLNQNFEKLLDTVRINHEISKSFFYELAFLESKEEFKNDLRILIGFLNKTYECYSYPSKMALKVRELSIKSIA